MGALAVLAAPAGSTEPGAEAEIVVLVRNTGATQDQFHVTVQGPAAAWTAVEPSLLTLDPGDEAPAWLRLRPPRSPATVPGDVPFTVVVASREDPEAPAVQDGVFAVGTFAAVDARVTTRHAANRRERLLVVDVHNAGNRRASVTVAAETTASGVDVEVIPEAIDLGPGDGAEAVVRLTLPRSLVPFRAPPRDVVVSAVSSAGALATVRTAWSDEASLRTELLRSAKLLVVVLVVLVVGGLALLRSESDSGTVDVTSGGARAVLPTATTTTEPPVDALPDGDVTGTTAAPAGGAPAAARAATPPALPPLAFVRTYDASTRDIVIRAAGAKSNELRLRSDDALESHPRLSPDRRFVAFLRERGDSSRLCVLPVGGGESACVADVAAGSAVAWARDGASLLFVRSGTLWSVPYDADAQQVGEEHDLGVAVGNAFDVSPDGDRIVTVDGDHLSVRPIAGGDGVRINVPGPPSDPVWSPDGSRIAYAAQFQIYTAPVGSGPIRQLTKAGTVNGEPAWTGEGDWVVFRSNRSGNGDLYAVHGVSANGEERGLAQLTDTRERESGPGF